tara:strand:- start:244 stop:888 length:645 start_codon:yes stop_codon:yes gene_type:complete
MADRIPLIVDSTAKQIQELPSGDDLVLSGQLKLTGTSDAGDSDITLSGGSDAKSVITVTPVSSKLSFVTKDSGGTSSTVQLEHDRIAFSGPNITGTAVTFSPTGAAPIYGVRAHGLITEKSSNGTYTGNLNGGNIASYDRLGTGEYKINFEHDMPNTNYTVITTPEYQDGGSDNGTNVLVRTGGKLAGSCRIVVTESQSGNDAKDQTFYIMVVG